MNAGADGCADAAPAPTSARTAATTSVSARVAPRVGHDDGVRVRPRSIGTFSSPGSDDNVVRPSSGCNVAPASDLGIVRHGPADVESMRPPVIAPPARSGRRSRGRSARRSRAGPARAGPRAPAPRWRRARRASPPRLHTVQYAARQRVEAGRARRGRGSAGRPRHAGHVGEQVQHVGAVADERRAVAHQRVGPGAVAAVTRPGTPRTARPMPAAKSAVIERPRALRGLDDDRHRRQRGDDPVARAERPACTPKPGGSSETTAPAARTAVQRGACSRVGPVGPAGEHGDRRRPPPSSAPAWAAESMPSAMPRDDVTPAAASPRARARGRPRCRTRPPRRAPTIPDAARRARARARPPATCDDRGRVGEVLELGGVVGSQRHTASRPAARMASRAAAGVEARRGARGWRRRRARAGARRRGRARRRARCARAPLDVQARGERGEQAGAPQALVAGVGAHAATALAGSVGRSPSAGVDVVGAERSRAVEVGDRARDAQDPRVAAGAERLGGRAARSSSRSAAGVALRRARAACRGVMLRVAAHARAARAGAAGARAPRAPRSRTLGRRPARASSRSARAGGRPTATSRSMRSSSGPLSRRRWRARSASVQRQRSLAAPARARVGRGDQRERASGTSPRAGRGRSPRGRPRAAGAAPRAPSARTPRARRGTGPRDGRGVASPGAGGAPPPTRPDGGDRVVRGAERPLGDEPRRRAARRRCGCA